MNRIKMLLVMFVLISLVVAITSSLGWSPVLPRWSWCIGCTDEVVRVLLNGKERIDAVYFPTRATIVAPVEGEVTLAMIWWSPFEIIHRGETKSPEYFWYVQLIGDTDNTPYLLAGWSDHPPQILVPEEVGVEWNTPIIYAEKGGFVGCYKYKGNNKDLARYFPTDWVPCEEGG